MSENLNETREEKRLFLTKDEEEKLKKVNNFKIFFSIAMGLNPLDVRKNQDLEQNFNRLARTAVNFVDDKKINRVEEGRISLTFNQPVTSEKVIENLKRNPLNYRPTNSEAIHYVTKIEDRKDKPLVMYNAKNPANLTIITESHPPEKIVEGLIDLFDDFSLKSKEKKQKEQKHEWLHADFQ